MTLKTAQETLAEALRIAEENGDTQTEYLLTALIDLTKSIRAEVRTIKDEIKALDRKIKKLR